jgi:hypothetical protein
MYRDHVTAASGHGGECYCGGGDGKQDGITDIAALAAGAIGAFLLYQAITMAAAGKRKKRDDGTFPSSIEIAKDIMFAGKIA